jgi:GNAT superfamily N-acetyltransferase
MNKTILLIALLCGFDSNHSSITPVQGFSLRAQTSSSSAAAAGRGSTKTRPRRQSSYSPVGLSLSNNSENDSNEQEIESSPLSLSAPSSSSSSSEKWTHSDIEWRLRPSEETPRMERIKQRAAAKAIRAECLLKGEPVPPVLCPKGGKAILEAYDKKNGTNKKIARFGITTSRGPSAPQIDETIQEVYDISFNNAGIGAIIYMFVEPEYRKLGIGELALEATYAIQTVQGCDFTVLVADDDGSNKLISWYERNGFTIAPKLQDMFGSPGGKFGTTMIRPTEVRSDIFARCQIKWW